MNCTKKPKKLNCTKKPKLLRARRLNPAVSTFRRSLLALERRNAPARFRPEGGSDTLCLRARRQHGGRANLPEEIADGMALFAPCGVFKA